MPNELIRVLAPATILAGDMLLSVELWTDNVFVHLARAQTDEMRRQWDEYASAAVDARDSGADMPLPPNFRIGDDLRLTDDVGTPYEQRSGASGGYLADPVRAVWAFEPGPPEAATRLTVTLGDDSLELAL
jgi:hypothetical protein